MRPSKYPLQETEAYTKKKETLSQKRRNPQSPLDFASSAANRAAFSGFPPLHPGFSINSRHMRENDG